MRLHSIEEIRPMSSAIAAGMTTAELLALPENGTERELIRGQLREKPMTYRNRFHTRAVSKVAYGLMRWLEERPEPRGEIHTGEVGCILRRDPDTVVGIDVAYFAPHRRRCSCRPCPVLI
jgi:Putative restriction endonuclease